MDRELELQLQGAGRWKRFWHTPVRAETLGLLRIIFGAVLLTDQLFQYLPIFNWLFGPHGIAPAGVNDEYLAKWWRWTIVFFNTDNLTILYSAFFIWMAATIAFMLGWRTRIMGVVVWLGVLCFLNRNPNVKNGGDDVQQLIIFLLMFSPCGAALSLDQLRRRKKLRALGKGDVCEPVYIKPWALRLFQIQLCVLYFTTGIAKLGAYGLDFASNAWWNGTALHYVLNDITLTRWPFAQVPQPLWMTAILTYISVWWETLFPFLIIWKRTRKWALYFGLLFHIGIYIMIEVGWFSFYTMTVYAAFIPSVYWMKRAAKRTSGEKVHSDSTRMTTATA